MRVNESISTRVSCCSRGAEEVAWWRWPGGGSVVEELKVAFAFGLAIAALAQCIGHISGAHLNPADTLGFLVSSQTSVLRAFFYVIAQVLGAVAGSAIMYGIGPGTADFLGVNKLNAVTPSQGLTLEFLLTLQLVLCLLAVSDQRRSVGLGHFPGVRYTGCGMNPARSFGPAAIMQSFDDHWVFWVGPMSAGVVAALLYNHLLTPRAEASSENTRDLFSISSSADTDTQEPLLDNVEDVIWSRRPAEV
ncbi:unnamed protein product [Pleuronectes platessa]|uniref:Uncharacterized protein n=1 Tax=Pleuronectes platessa TaxID=8262 RepID=A0A9N7YZL9_PLEPL|nr:unnamed protein product [Pleuronectes platessa]